MSKSLQVIFGLILIALVPTWTFLITPEILKLPANVSYKANMVHTENNRFDIDSQWGGKSIAISNSNVKTLSTVGDKSTLRSNFKVESLTGEILFELDQNFLINRLTRHNLSGGNDKNGTAFILFPPNVSQNNVNFWPIEMGAPTTLKYLGSETIQKLNTFHFSARDAIIDDTLGYEFLPLVPEKYKVLSKINIDVYVEPVTGIIVNYEDSGTSFYADKKNKNIWDIAEWSNKYNDPTISERVKEAASTKKKYNMYLYIIPMSLALLGILLVILGFRRINKRAPKS